jgi:hypothetical protein
MYVRHYSETTSFIGLDGKDTPKIAAKCAAFGTSYRVSIKNMADGSNALKLAKDISYWR